MSIKNRTTHSKQKNYSHALKVILNDNLAGDILESEAVKIGELLEKINTTYDRLKLELTE